MSALEDFKERLSSDLKSLAERVQESSLFVQLKDKYENLTPIQQKISVVFVSLFVLYIFFSIPLSYYSTSSDYVTEFEEKRDRIRELLKVTRDAKETPNIPVPPDMSTLRAQIQGLLESDRLIPTQIKGIENAVTTSRLIPNNLSQGTVNVSLAELNLRQLVEIAHQLQSISQSVKMTDLEITANSKNSHYFDVIYKLVVLAIPQQVESSDFDNGNKGN